MFEVCNFGLWGVPKAYKTVYNTLMEKKNKQLYSIYVGNLHYNLDENHILGLFKSFGYIENIKILREGKENTSKGVAFVNMVDLKAAEAAVKALNELPHCGRTLKVRLANTQNFVEKPKMEKAVVAPVSKEAIDNQMKKQRRKKKVVDFTTLFKSKSKS